MRYVDKYEKFHFIWITHFHYTIAHFVFGLYFILFGKYLCWMDQQINDGSEMSSCSYTRLSAIKSSSRWTFYESWFLLLIGWRSDRLKSKNEIDSKWNEISKICNRNKNGKYNYNKFMYSKWIAHILFLLNLHWSSMNDLTVDDRPFCWSRRKKNNELIVYSVRRIFFCVQFDFFVCFIIETHTLMQ